MQARFRGDVLERLMLEHNLTTRRLGEMVDRSSAIVSLWRRGERCPGADSRQRLQTVFGRRFRDLFEPVRRRPRTGAVN